MAQTLLQTRSYDHSALAWAGCNGYYLLNFVALDHTSRRNPVYM